MADGALDESNEGFKMLRAMGWKEGAGLGKGEKGRVLPLSATLPEESGRLGLGRATQEEDMTTNAAKQRRKLDSELEDTADRKRKREEKAAGERELAATLEAQHANFYCACCDKQYKTVAEFSNHLSSYDHGHRKRFAEMREAERNRAGGADAVAAKRRKEDARQARELQRQIDAAAARAPPAVAAPAAAAAAPPAPTAPAPAGDAPRAKFGFGLAKKPTGKIKFGFGKR
jgi:septal ring factor EnvC (AmiA/AmiB activator)